MRQLHKKIIAEAWVGSVQPECTLPLSTWNFQNFKPEFLFDGKHFMCVPLKSKMYFIYKTKEQQIYM